MLVRHIVIYMIVMVIVLSSLSYNAIGAGEFTGRRDFCLQPLVVLNEPNTVGIDVSQVMKYVHLSPFVHGVIVRGNFSSGEVRVVGYYGAVNLPVKDGSVFIPVDVLNNITLNRRPLEIRILGADNVSRICIDFYDVKIRVTYHLLPVSNATVELVPYNKTIHAPVIGVTDSKGYVLMNYEPLPHGYYYMYINSSYGNYTTRLELGNNDNGKSIQVDLASISTTTTSSQHTASGRSRSRAVVYVLAVLLLLVASLAWLWLRYGSRLGLHMRFHRK